MPQIHYFQRYSSLENTVTNNTLQLIARIQSYSPQRAAQFLSNLTDTNIDIGVEIHQQQRSGDSVPDGSIIQRSFKILIESKVDSGVDEKQLIRHADSFSNEQVKVLILLTKNALSQVRKNKLSESIKANSPSAIMVCVTYEEVCEQLQGLFLSHETEMNELIEDYVSYCNETDLIDSSKYRLRIVPCGNSFDINKKHQIYFHPSDRGYSKHAYLGIYKHKAVRLIWKIEAVYDVTFDGVTLSKELIEGFEIANIDERLIGMIQDAREECGYEIGSNHRFFCATEIAETEYIKESKGGIQGSRLHDLKKELNELDLDKSSIQEIADHLSKSRWE